VVAQAVVVVAQAQFQGALQDASQGFLFLPWNGNLSDPWRE
jgi:hypothetical protein